MGRADSDAYHNHACHTNITDLRHCVAHIHKQGALLLEHLIENLHKLVTRRIITCVREMGGGGTTVTTLLGHTLSSVMSSGTFALLGGLSTRGVKQAKHAERTGAATRLLQHVRPKELDKRVLDALRQHEHLPRLVLPVIRGSNQVVG